MEQKTDFQKLIDGITALGAELAEATRMREVYYTLACDYTNKSVDLESRLAQMTQERDDIQLRLHAIDHAYSEQQTRENTLLRDALQRNVETMETIRRQRQFIRTLYTSRKARKAKGSTSAQSERENGLKVKIGGNAAVYEGNLKRTDVIRQEEGMRSGQKPCRHAWVTSALSVTIVCATCGAILIDSK